VTLPEEATGALAELAGVALAQQDLPAALEEICRIAVRTVPGAEGASVTTFSEGGRPAAIADGAWAQELDELQYAEHEGPCYDAYRTGNIFRIRDLANEPRWPSYVPRAVEHGARSVVSLAMSAEGKLVGALNLYCSTPDAFTAEAVAVAEVVAAHAGLAGQVAAAMYGHRDLAMQLAEAMRSRAVIEQAKGILMGARRCDADTAFKVLAELSQNSNRKLRDVAQALVAEASKNDG
jgi:transcriptional regulator with GAF, ATPase, and Fis domain